jgi:hypothetical protein
MPAYDVICTKCGHFQEIRCSVAEHATRVELGVCVKCGGSVRQYITGCKHIMVRDATQIRRFGKGEFFEHGSPDGFWARSKSEVADKAAEHGMISKLVEDV